MNLSELLEDSNKDLVIIYPGRFHPFHIGHGKVYKYLKQKYSNAQVFISTSGKVDGDRSPFTFEEKKKMMILAGVDSGAIVQCKSPYQSIEILERFDKDNTVVVFAVSEKDMAEEPRFDFSGGIKLKKNGEPAYMQKWNGLDSAETFATRGYIATTPTFKFKVLGQEINSASQIRNMIAKSDDTKLTQMLQDLYSITDVPQDIIDLFKSKVGNKETMNENWDEHSFCKFLQESINEENTMKDGILQTITEGKSPHKKGTKKYNAHMAAIHAESFDEEFDAKVKQVVESKLKNVAADIKDYVDDHKEHFDAYPMDVEVNGKVYDFDDYWKILDTVYPDAYDNQYANEGIVGDVAKATGHAVAKGVKTGAKLIGKGAVAGAKKLSRLGSKNVSSKFDGKGHVSTTIAYNEATQKPYVSMYKDKDNKNKMVYDVLDKYGKSAFKSYDEDEAMKYFKDNYKSMREVNEDSSDSVFSIRKFKNAKDPSKDGLEITKTGGMGGTVIIKNQRELKDLLVALKGNVDNLKENYANEQHEKLEYIHHIIHDQINKALNTVEEMFSKDASKRDRENARAKEKEDKGLTSKEREKRSWSMVASKDYSDKQKVSEAQVLAHGGKGQYKAVSDGGVVRIMHKGKEIASGDFDSGADGWFVSREDDKGQKFFGNAQDMVDHFAENIHAKTNEEKEELKEFWPAVAYAASRIPASTYASAGTAIAGTASKAGKWIKSKLKSSVDPKLKEDYNEDDSSDLEKMQNSYKHNEDRNNHSENILMLAQAFGSRPEIKAVEGLLTIIRRQGYTTPEQSEMMYNAIHKKYYSQLFPAENEGNEFSGALAKAKIDGKKTFDVDGKTYKVKEALSKLLDSQKTNEAGIMHYSNAKGTPEYKEGQKAAKNGEPYNSNPYSGAEKLKWSKGHNEWRHANKRKKGEPNYGARGQFE
ncbi:MAG: hypothetical protein H8D95_00300 [Candidatus Endolissoclinum sp.]|nr:hypothetical protein [Candidatus Endolissoclinum sp.]